MQQSTASQQGIDPHKMLESSYQKKISMHRYGEADEKEMLHCSLLQKCHPA
jgi:hypothetical protein